jgi:serine/threonine protein kinase
VSVTTQPGGPPPTAAPPFQPEPFGKYVLVDRIATGGMAEIFKAKSFSHGGFESLLVIKRILPHIGDNAEFIEMFQDEAKVSVALQHPNIVRIFDFGRIQSGNVAHWFIVMECVDGKDVRNLLRKLARRKEFMPPELSAYVALEACKGLFYAHTKTDTKGNPFGIVHRDISPSNILLSYEGEVKIADFGIAKAESNAYQTRDGVLKGKFEYMSPEQAQGVEFDHRSDLFSLGILLWETLTGRRLFKTESETATLTKVREARIDSPDAIKSDLPPRLVQICMKALSKEPGDRYATAAEMEQDLRDFLFPETSDTIKARFREFLAGLFAEEHAEERRRLESTEPAVAALRERLVAEWETQHDVTMSRVTQTTVQQVVPWVAAIALAMLGAFAVAVAVVVGFVVLRPDPEPDTQGIQAQPSDRTVLNIVVVPTARIWVNGELRETSKGLVLEDLQPGTYLVKLEAEGVPDGRGVGDGRGGHARQPHQGPRARPDRRPGPHAQPRRRPGRAHRAAARRLQVLARRGRGAGRRRAGVRHAVHLEGRRRGRQLPDRDEARRLLHRPQLAPRRAQGHPEGVARPRRAVRPDPAHGHVDGRRVGQRVRRRGQAAQDGAVRQDRGQAGPPRDQGREPGRRLRQDRDGHVRARQVTTLRFAP